MQRLIAIAAGLCFSALAAAQTHSDKELKQHVEPIRNPLRTVIQLKPATYEYDTGRFGYLQLPAGRQYGFVSEEANAILPGITSYSQVSYMKGKNRYVSAKIPVIHMENLVPLLVAAIQEQQQQIEKLSQELAELRNNRK